MTAAESEDKPPEPSGEAEPKPTRMVAKEQQIGWLIVAVTIGGLAASWAGDAAGGDGRALALLALGIGLTTALAVAVWYGHRIITSFAAIVAGFAPVKTGLVYLSFVSLGYGGFLMFRSSRAQMKAAATRPRRSASEASQARQAKAEAKAGAKTGARADHKAGDGARRPTANRRYTPPKGKGARRGR